MTKTKRRIHAAGAALLLASMTLATAAAQPILIDEYHVTSGAATNVHIANLKKNWVVTAVENGGGNLELTSWQYANSQLTGRASLTNGPASKLAIASVSSSRVATAMINGSGNLEVIVWSIASNGFITGEGDFVGGPASTVDIAALSSKKLVTAVEDGGGNLALNVFAIDSGGNLTSQGSVTDGAVTKTHLAVMSSSQFVTAVQTSAGNLALSSWGVDANGNITHQADASKGMVTQVDITPWGAAGHVATAVRNGALHLEVLDWTVNPTTGAIALLASNGAGNVSKVTATTIGSMIFTATNVSGKLNIGVWDYNDLEQNKFEEVIGKTYDSAIGVVTAAPLTTGTVSVTASENSAGNLELNVWEFYIIT